MALDDVDSVRHFWYASAYGNMDDYARITSEDFGAGEKNTKNMITKWNSRGYGLQNDNDMWGLSTVQSKIKENPAWYVPSKEEWSAFGGELEITTSNYSSKGLSDCYWLSSQKDGLGAWYANFNKENMHYTSVSNYYYVRLGTTF